MHRVGTSTTADARVTRSHLAPVPRVVWCLVATCLLGCGSSSSSDPAEEGADVEEAAEVDRDAGTDADAEPAGELDGGADVESAPDAQAEPEPDADDAEAETRADGEPQPDDDSEPEAGSDAEPAPDAAAEPEADAAAELEPELHADADPDASEIGEAGADVMADLDGEPGAEASEADETEGEDADGCPDRGGRLFTWQLRDIYDSSTALAELNTRTGVTHGIITTSPQWLEYLLGNFQAAGMGFAPQLAKWDDYTTPDEYFDFAAWESVIRGYEDLDLDLTQYIEDGTFAGVMILDDLGNFADEGPGSATLDQMAAVIKDVFDIQAEHDVTIFVRHDPTDLLRKHEGHEFSDLDTVYAQATAIKARGDLEAWIESQNAAADELGLELIWGVNLLDWELEDASGDCPSGHAGFRSGRCVISPEDLDVVSDLIATLGCNSGTGGWRISDDQWSFLFEDDTYAAALRGLAAAAD